MERDAGDAAPADRGARPPVEVLGGAWLVAADPGNRGREEGWFAAARQDARPAPVPGIIQQVYPTSHGVFWYYLDFTPAVRAAAGERVLVRFGAVDYLADVWLNGRSLGGHEGGETPFDLDATEALEPGRPNLLAVRVLNPTRDAIDGIRLDETPHRNKRCHDDFVPGSSFNCGGIILPVTLQVVPALRIADVFARPDRATGRIDLTVTLRNDTDRPLHARLRAGVAPAAEGRTLASAFAEASAPAGASLHDLALELGTPRTWDLDDPNLYRVSVELESETDGASVRHDRSVRVGFRDLRVEGGYFHLNGRRIFLRSTHTGNHCPVGQVVPLEPDLLRRDLLMAKVAGYNAVRFISGMPYPEQLDFCDEIGLMVYEECYAAWLLGEGPDMARQFDLSVREMILRDRNHPSVTIWGMLNETPPGNVFKHAVAGLKLVRELDPTRLVLLSSGRWDGEPRIGSVSNPGSGSWEPAWGVEGPDAPQIDFRCEGNVFDWKVPAYVDRAGDAHVYPPLPQRPEHAALLRTMGADTKPVFLSEYGVGSQFNAIDELKGYDRFEARDDLFDRAYIRSMAERLAADFARFGMDEAYPFPEDFLRASYGHMVRQRRLVFDLVRSNPRLCGYNITGMLDHALTGEGIWGFWRAWKPGIADVMQDGWAPARWCLFVDPMHAYAGRPVAVEAVLANEAVLGPGEYPATFRIFGQDTGTVWERRAAVRIPAAGRDGTTPLAVPVLKQVIETPLAPGEYVFAASLERGAAPRSDRLRFLVSDAPSRAHAPGPVALLGVSAEAESWLGRRGFACLPFDARSAGEAKAILVGDVAAGAVDADVWRAVLERVERGATAAFLSAAPFMAGPSSEGPSPALPLGDDVRARRFNDWLYHRDIVARRHDAFAGLRTGLLDWDFYGQVGGHDVFDLHTAPAEIVAASFAVGYPCTGGYDCGVVVASLRRGEGRVLLSSLRTLDNLDRHPAADRLMTNLVGLACRR